MKSAIFSRNKSQIHLIKFITQIFRRLRLVAVMLLVAALLSGCVDYDLGVNFQNPNSGEFTQHIKLGEQLTSFSKETAQQWLDSIEKRTKQLQGRIRRISKQEITVTIPFNTGKELEEKFNQFFNPPVKKGLQAQNETAVDLPEINSRFKLQQGNFIFWVRNRLVYDLDLRSLGVISNNGNVLVSPGSLVDLDFSLTTPGGAKSIEKAPNSIIPTITNKGQQIVWKLKPGEINHLEAVFWLPNSLGIGTIAIVLIIVGGFYLKYRHLPGRELFSVQPQTSVKL